MVPSPARPIEVRIGGLNRVALRRAAHHDGWLGLSHTPDEVRETVRFLDAEREALGRAQKPFDVMIAHYPVSTDPGEYERYREVGVHSINVPPWRYRGIDSIDLAEKRRSLEAFAEHYIVPLSG
jgi:alkanesulfonate monooxygenase SsuD/methylene tetrahydromethanopterin reductase-like flavin-dependent oxidoreductase (luciferase family)